MGLFKEIDMALMNSKHMPDEYVKAEVTRVIIAFKQRRKKVQQHTAGVELKDDIK